MKFTERNIDTLERIARLPQREAQQILKLMIDACDNLEECQKNHQDPIQNLNDEILAQTKVAFTESYLLHRGAVTALQWLAGSLRKTPREALDVLIELAETSRASGRNG